MQPTMTWDVVEKEIFFTKKDPDTGETKRCRSVYFALLLSARFGGTTVVYRFYRVRGVVKVRTPALGEYGVESRVPLAEWERDARRMWGTDAADVLIRVRAAFPRCAAS